MKFQIYKNDDSEWYWRLKAKNGEIIASGEGYKNKKDCLHCVDLIKSTDESTPVEEV